MNQQATLIALIDREKLSANQICFRAQQYSTVKDVVEYLKHQLNTQFEFKLFFGIANRKNFEFGVWNVKKMYLLLKLNFANEKKMQPLFATKQTEPESYISSYQFSSVDEQKKPTSHINNLQTNSNFQNQMPLINLVDLNNQVKQFLENHINNYQFNQRLCILEDQQKKQNPKVQEEEMQFSIKQQFSKLESSIQTLNDKIINLSQENFKDWKAKVDAQLQQLQQQIRSSSSLLMTTGTKVFTPELNTQTVIRLLCKHQIEKNVLENIILNSISQYKPASCQTCKKNISQSICRQLG